MERLPLDRSVLDSALERMDIADIAQATIRQSGDIARIMDRFSVLIVECKHDRDNIDSTAVVSNDELKKIDAPEDLTDLVASRGTRK